MQLTRAAQLGTSDNEVNQKAEVDVETKADIEEAIDEEASEQIVGNVWLSPATPPNEFKTNSDATASSASSIEDTSTGTPEEGPFLAPLTK